MSAAVEQGGTVAAARGHDLGTWRGSRADLVNDDLAAAKLVRRVQLGDVAAFDLLDRAFRHGVYVYLWPILRNDDDAEEVTQLVFMRALENIRACRIASEPFGAWLYRIARNAAIDHLRKHTRVACEEPARIDRRRDRADPASATRWGSQEALSEAIGRLPEVQRSVIVLRYLVGLSATEVGSVLGCSADSVRHFHHRARRSLRSRLYAAMVTIVVLAEGDLGAMAQAAAGAMAG
jgi:RNA polymerase sigma-70 factor (ECF subfamily)